MAGYLLFFNIYGVGPKRWIYSARAMDFARRTLDLSFIVELWVKSGAILMLVEYFVKILYWEVFFFFSEFWSESLWMAILFRHTLWISLHFYYNFKRFNFSNKKRMHIKPSKSTTATTTMELAHRISSRISLDITYIICISAARFDTFHTLYPTSIVKYRHNIEFSAWRMLFDAQNSVPNGFQTQWPRNYISKCKPRNTYLKSDWMFAIYIKKGLYKNQVLRHILNFHLIANIDIFLNSWIGFVEFAGRLLVY